MMIAVVVVAILATIAYPSYQEHLRASRRADAQGVLLQAAQFMERHYSDNLRYDSGPGGTPVALPAALTESPVDGAPKFYDIALHTVAATAFVLRATPKNGQAGDGYLEYTNSGGKRWDRDNSGGVGADEQCWAKGC